MRIMEGQTVGGILYDFFVFYTLFACVNMCSEQKKYFMDYVDGTYCKAKIAFNIWLTFVISHV